MVAKFSDYSKKWLEKKKDSIKYSTYCAYLNIVLNYLNVYFDNLNELDAKAINDFFANLKSSLGNKSLKGIYLVLRMIVKDAGLDASLLSCLNGFKDTRKKIDVLNKSEHRKLLKYVDEHFTFINLGFLITISTGVRIGEICALKWEDVDLENNLIHINKTLQRVYIASDKSTKLIVDKPKTIESIRDIPITNFLRKSLNRFSK